MLIHDVRINAILQHLMFISGKKVEWCLCRGVAKGDGAVGNLGLSFSSVHSSIVFNNRVSAYSVGMLAINI